eukprot:SAG25_NODE_3238_length_1162_cov_10.987770_1_plen_57_part_10
MMRTTIMRTTTVTTLYAAAAAAATTFPQDIKEVSLCACHASKPPAMHLHQLTQRMIL